MAGVIGRYTLSMGLGSWRAPCTPSVISAPTPGIVVRTMLMRPNNLKYQKCQKNIRAVLPRHPPGPVPVPKPDFGTYGVYSMESLRITAAQIEAARVAIMKTIGRKGLKIWVRIFPHIPVTKKPLGVRMGKGKGAVNHFVAHVRYGKMLFEFESPTENLAKRAYTQVNYKLPIKTRLTVSDKVTNKI